MLNSTPTVSPASGNHEQRHPSRAERRNSHEFRYGFMDDSWTLVDAPNLHDAVGGERGEFPRLRSPEHGGQRAEGTVEPGPLDVSPLRRRVYPALSLVVAHERTVEQEHQLRPRGPVADARRGQPPAWIVPDDQRAAAGKADRDTEHGMMGARDQPPGFVGQFEDVAPLWPLRASRARGGKRAR